MEKLKFRLFAHCFTLCLTYLIPGVLLADNPPIVIIPTAQEEQDDLLVETSSPDCYLNISTHQIIVSADITQWQWVYIYSIDTGTICYEGLLDGTQNNESYYYIQSPTQPGLYCIVFQGYSEEARGYFSIY